jgi:hypothetical protein
MNNSHATAVQLPSISKAVEHIIALKALGFGTVSIDEVKSMTVARFLFLPVAGSLF